MQIDQLILATNNEHKIREMRQLLRGLNITILCKSDFPDFPDVEETGVTLHENALLKSRAIFDRYGIPAVADDTGLEVKFLKGAPGVVSARYAGENCTFEDNNRKLLKELQGVPVEERQARFVTIIAISSQQGDHVLEGVADGVILTESRGSNGFGYDPIFYYPPLDRTFAQLSAEEKNQVSHRGIALRKLKEWLESEF